MDVLSGRWVLGRGNGRFVANVAGSGGGCHGGALGIVSLCLGPYCVCVHHYSVGRGRFREQQVACGGILAAGFGAYCVSGITSRQLNGVWRERVSL